MQVLVMVLVLLGAGASANDGVGVAVEPEVEIGSGVGLRPADTALLVIMRLPDCSPHSLCQMLRFPGGSSRPGHLARAPTDAYIHMYTCIHIYIYTNAYICIHTYMYTDAYI